MSTQPLRIGVDLTSIWRHPTGIFRYATEIAKHLLLIEKEMASPVRYTFFFAREIHPDFVPFKDAFEAVICPTTNELLIKQFWFPFVLPRLQLNVVHYPAFPPPSIQLFGLRSVMTLHDAGPWRYPQALTLHGRLYFRTLLTQGMRRCTRVITVSKHAKTEIGHFLGEHYLPKISVVPEAATPAFALTCDDSFKAEVQERYKLPAHYFLAVATVEPRKNLVRLLDAYMQLHTHWGEACPALVIVGRKGWNCDDILGYMEKLAGAVYFPGRVSDEELVALYQMATSLVFPSLYEGFGLPVVEAMMAGCPVITSHTSSLPEVAGDAGLLVDPQDVEAIAAAMRQVGEDKNLRKQMIEKGRQRASSFSWMETARLTRETYLLAASS